MYKKTIAIIVVILAIVCLIVLTVQSGDADKYKLHVKFLPGQYMLKISTKEHTTSNGTTLFLVTTEELWNVYTQPCLYPEKLSFELKEKSYSLQKEASEFSNALDVAYDSNQPRNDLTSIQSLFVGPKPGTKLEAHLCNNCQKFGDIKIIKQGDPSDSFPEKRFNYDFNTINDIHNLLPTKKVKIGDHWKRSVARPIPGFGKFTELVNTVFTFESIEKNDMNSVEFSVINIEIDSQQDKLTVHLGDMAPMLYDEFSILSTGKIVLNISSGTPVLYAIKTKVHYTIFGQKHEMQNEYKCEFIFTPE